MKKAKVSNQMQKLLSNGDYNMSLFSLVELKAAVALMDYEKVFEISEEIFKTKTKATQENLKKIFLNDSLEFIINARYNSGQPFNQLKGINESTVDGQVFQGILDRILIHEGMDIEGLIVYRGLISLNQNFFLKKFPKEMNVLIKLVNFFKEYKGSVRYLHEGMLIDLRTEFDIVRKMKPMKSMPELLDIGHIYPYTEGLFFNIRHFKNCKRVEELKSGNCGVIDDGMYNFKNSFKVLFSNTIHFVTLYGDITHIILTGDASTVVVDYITPFKNKIEIISSKDITIQFPRNKFKDFKGEIKSNKEVKYLVY